MLAPLVVGLAGVATAAASLVAVLVGLLLAYRRQSERERIAGDALHARLEAGINAVPVEFVEYDKDRRLILANQAARNASPWRVPGAASGRTIDAVMAAYIDHFQTADTGAAWKAWAEQSVADFDRGGVAVSWRPDGQWRRSYVSDMPGGGRVVVRVDITDEKKREEKLAAEMELLSSVFESTGAGILMLDRDLRVVLANQFVLDVEGVNATDIVGRPYADLSFTGLDPAIVAKWQGASGGERLKAVEFEHVIVVGGDGSEKAGQRIFRTTANPVQDKEGRLRYIVLIGVDDTERRLGEIRLFDSSRLANLGEMATGMAHEINQPLAVIRMAAESLVDELEMPEAASITPDLAELLHFKLGRISNQTDRAAKLVNELRAVARKPTNQALPFNVVDSARVASDLLHEQLKAVRIAFALDLPSAETGPGLMVTGEPNRLQQVLLNLVLNARDSLLDDKRRQGAGSLGSIVLKVDAAAGAPEHVVLTVEDDGPGIAPHNLPRLFEPFFTTKPTGKGTGLGLSISYDIVRRMGGEITAENRPEGGARFRIELPTAGTASPP